MLHSAAAISPGATADSSRRALSSNAGAASPRASVIRASYHFVGAASKGSLSQFTTGGEYYLSKRTTLYATLAQMTASKMYNPGILGGAPGADKSSLAFGTGIRHTF